MKFHNAKDPKRFYGLHFAEGVAEYREPGQEPYRVFLNEATAKKMDASFDGKPVYVRHVNEVDLTDKNEIDGWVVKSFFNKADGKHWVEFLVVSDRGLQAIEKGWRLSNAYFPESFGSGGQWHGVDYQKEVLGGQYEHLAIVDNPRYDESVIFTPEQFKAYNDSKEAELKRLANSKGEPKVKFNFFKKAKVENSAELEATSVTLPESKKEVTLSEAIELADKHVIMNMQGYANEDHMVKVGEEEMSVKDLVNKFSAMASEKKANEDKKEEEKKENEDEKKDEEKKENAPESEEKKDKEEKKENSKEEEQEHFEAIKNAHEKAPIGTHTVDLDKVARGKSRYGSGK